MNSKERNGLRFSWLTHRAELAPWGVAILVYVLIMKGGEPSKFTYTIQAMIFLLPPLVVFRIVKTATAVKDRKIVGENYDEEG